MVWDVGCYSDCVGMQVRSAAGESLAEPKTQIFFNSAIAQWWSIRLLTEGLQVRVLLAELKAPNYFGAL